MNRKSQRGVALVITLIMLSMVTLMAVVFLSVSRSQKASVAVTANQVDSRLMTDAALARAVAEIASRILATTNSLNYDLMVSTNFINPLGFQTGDSSPANVSYTYANGRLLSGIDRLQNLVNLQYDPRPPVYVQTNRNGNTEFRYYLDLNRNGLAETNGLLPMLGRVPGEFIGTDGQPTRTFSPGRIQMGNFVGDPEWIGVLEYPDRPHSDSNRFVGRYAYLVVPEGKTLDINHIHNNAKSPEANLTRDGFVRNHGIGSWELNLAAFLRDLNTNVWGYNLYQTSSAPSLGTAFDDAAAILADRYYDPLKGNRQLDSVYELFGASGENAVKFDGLDTYSDGPLLLAQSIINFDGRPTDNTRKSWSGSRNPQGYYDVEELYNQSLDRSSRIFAQRLALATTNSASSYDRYSFYRLVGQLGTDSRPAVSNLLYQPNFLFAHTNKLHINYRNDFPNGQTNFIPWDPIIDPSTLTDPSLVRLGIQNPIDFFYQAADRLIRANLTTNDPFAGNRALALFQRPNFFLGEIPVRDTVSLTNIQIYNNSRSSPFYMTNNEYTPTTHRLLQLAANIYDSATRRTIMGNDYPSVFRPTFLKTVTPTETNVIINGYVDELSAAFWNNPWHTVEEVASDARIRPDTTYSTFNIFGIPSVIGTKKGYPNFNEATLQTVMQVSRKLEFRRLASGALQTNQMYVLGISNLFGVEAWNSYTQSFDRPLTMMVTNRQTIHLRSVLDRGGVRFTNFVTLPGGAARVTSATIVTNRWPGGQNPSAFVLPIVDSFTFLPNRVYQSQFGTFTTNNVFERSVDVPEWTLQITNRLQYMLIDNSVSGVPRMVDFVNLDNLVSEINITERLMGNRTAGAGGYFSDARQFGTITDDSIWFTNRVVLNDRNSPPVGLTNQIGVSMGLPLVGAGTWQSASGDPVGGRDKEKSIQQFSNFMRGRSTNLVMQAPFTPTRKIFERKTWQANDPLVHYTVGDLTDFALTNSFGVIQPAENPVPPSNLGLLNERYRPWGGSPNKQGSDATDYRLTLKDPGVTSSDDWNFPRGKFANVGTLGRVHRGSPWQTIYLKAGEEDVRLWRNWAGSFGTHPTNDWKILDLFTVAPNDEAATGLLSVNQTNAAAWSAVLSGVSVLSNSIANPGSMNGMLFDAVFVQPSSPQLSSIVAGINRARIQQPKGVFRTLGDVLATPELTVASPFLNLNSRQQIERGLTDEAVERIPQQIMSLLKTDEPRVVVYSFGQSLKPAERSLVTSGNFYNICTNYQITGELVTKTVLRIEDAPHKPRTVVESFTILPPQ